MVAGTANSPSVAEQALFMMLTLAKRAVEMHSLVKDGKWGTGSACCRSISSARPC
jgi:D-3-phosphoglycerate dehydrogenase